MKSRSADDRHTRDDVPDEMTIGELAGRFGLAPHVLRHWEAMGLLDPAKRVSGRRRYRREHVARVAMILRGKEAGLSLQQIHEVLHAPDPQTRRKLVQQHHARLEERIAAAQAAKVLIEHVLSCPAEDFIQCPEFQRLIHAAVAPASSGEADHRTQPHREAARGSRPAVARPRG